MATHRTKYASDAELNVFRGVTYPAVPANFYAALLTIMPTKNDMTSAVEVSGDGYARIAIPTSTASWSAPTTLGDDWTEQIATLVAQTFPADTTASWGTIVGAAIYDALTGGNCWRFGDLSAVQFVAIGNIIQLAATALTASAN